MQQIQSVLIVEDEDAMRIGYKAAFKQRGIDSDGAGNLYDGLGLGRQKHHNLAITDGSYSLAPFGPEYCGAWMEFCPKIKEIEPDIIIFLVSATEGNEEAAKAMGARYINKEGKTAKEIVNYIIEACASLSQGTPSP